MACSSSSSSLLPCSSPSRCSSLRPKSFNRCFFREVNYVGNGSLDLHLRLSSRILPFSTRISCLRDYKANTVTWKSWDNLVLKSEGPVLVEFYASWCGPCQMVHRVIDEIAAEYKGRIQCLVLNTDDDLKVAEKYDIKAVPVVLIFKDGKKQGSVVGTMPKEFYVAAIDKALAS